MGDECFKILGNYPYQWQLDVAEAIHLLMHVVVIAPTGAGKTIPFILPLLIEGAEHGMVLIISPLQELQNDQVV
jgi:ATP-dependent helicase YprA (DUF1998 family)